MNACCSKVCRWLKVPMHHLYPLTDRSLNWERSAADRGQCLQKGYRYYCSEPEAVGSKIAPKAMQLIVTGLPAGSSRGANCRRWSRRSIAVATLIAPWDADALETECGPVSHVVVRLVSSVVG